MERLREADYFEEALRLVANGGIRLVTISNLCGGLQVTKGSFYHHFENMQTFMEKFLLYWEDAYSLRYIDQAHAIADPTRRLEYLFQTASHFHHEAERAIRAYSCTDPFAAKMQERVDLARALVVAECYESIGLDRRQAATQGRLALAVLVGAQETIRPPTPAAVQRMLKACAVESPLWRR